jgi:hypothetical protein
MNRLVIFLLIVSPIFSHAQKRLDLIHDNAFAFYDYNEKAFCVLDDSTFIWKYDATKIKWQKVPLELSIDMPFAKFLSDFIPMSEKETPVYFVHAGCGVVFILNNNKISRHDHSFYHMNQFGGSFFMDEGEPRIYGGYGLFTSKNITTRYDTIEREWFAIYSNNIPPPAGLKNIIQKYKNSYYILDGFSGLASHYKAFTDLWRFDIATKKWENLGRVNPTIIGKKIELNYERFQIQNNLFSCFPNMIVVYDFDNLRFKKYKINSFGLFRKIINVGELFLIFKTTSKPSRYVEISNSDFLKQFEMEEGALILKQPSFIVQYKWLIVFFLITFSLLFIWIIKKKTNRKKKLNSNNKLSRKSFIDEFNPTEVQLIQLLLDHQETGLEISFINDLVNQDQPSVDTLKKRRESLLKELRYKLAAKFNIPQKEVFIEQRMISDKRMKLLFLNKLVIKDF